MIVKHLLQSPYHRGFPGLNGIVQDHEMFVALIEEHRQKMIETRDDELPHRLPLYGTRTDAVAANNIELGISNEAEVEPIAWVTGFHIESLGFKYNLSLWVEYDKDVLGENFFNSVRFGYYTLMGIQETAPNGLIFAKPTKLASFHLDMVSDEIAKTGKLPQSTEE